MIEHDTKIKYSNFLVIFLTFKENCPDILNTKFIDIIQELQSFKCHVDIYDPWVDKAEAKLHYGFELIDNPFENNKKYDAIVVAVGHEQFVALSSENYTKLSRVIIDVKGIVKNPTWRL